VGIVNRIIRATARTRDEEGQSLVEMAICLPILLVLLVGIIQFGTWFWTGTNLSSATREAGLLLAASKNDPNAEQDVENRLAANLDSEIDPTKLSYSFSPHPAASTPLWSSGETVTMTVSYPDQLNLMGVPLGGSAITSTAQVRMQ
jgi:Flp pilus assembly protein TadG